jgi:hypothetical protein
MTHPARLANQLIRQEQEALRKAKPRDLSKIHERYLKEKEWLKANANEFGYVPSHKLPINGRFEG